MKNILFNTEMTKAILDGRKVLFNIDNVNRILATRSGKIFRRSDDTEGDSDFLMARLIRGSQKSKTNGCILWIKAKNGQDYGTLRVNNKKQYAHRISYILHYGSIDNEMIVCHKCDNFSCINPHHLFQGTQSDNMKDCYDKGRSGIKPHSMNGSDNPSSKLYKKAK